MFVTPARDGRRTRWLQASVIAAAALGLLAAATVSPGQAKAASGVLGMDVSSFQGDVDWQSAANNGAQFAYVKASEGSTYTNPNFGQQYGGSYDVGMIRGAYHFALPNNGASGASQADFFIQSGGGWSADGKTLPPALDIEYNPYTGNSCYDLSQGDMVSWIADFVNEMHARTSKYPMIYTTFDWWQTCTGNSSAFAATDPFWIASYSASPPTSIPAGSATYTIWQNADSGIFPGDQNEFNGDYSRLIALASTPD
jgi:GH25 family lysozyme M1 (1,4-beta-N-acetylmuramidase)